MAASHDLLLCGFLMVLSFPVTVVGFFSAAAAAAPPQHQLRAGGSSTPRTSLTGSLGTATAAAADKVPTTPTAHGENELTGDRDDGGSNIDGSASSERFKNFADFLISTQGDICRQAEASDGKATFCTDRWEREGAGEGFGITRVLEGGELLEKAACSVSVIHGVLTPERAQAMSSRGRANINAAGGQPYSAAAMSLVFHTASPLVPTFRADVRYLEVAGEGWFGGGADLTPYYLDDDDVKGFHGFYKDICDRYDSEAYPRFKKWADDYFYIPMRKEHRGVGGIFFDDLESIGDSELGGATEGNKGIESFVREVALGFMPSFLPIAENRGRQAFTEEQRQWQLMRRGRYLEFNLLYDRGVKFGLSGGRVESIMVSAPPMVSWRYNHTPAEGSEEDRLLQILRKPQQWVS